MNLKNPAFRQHLFPSDLKPSSLASCSLLCGCSGGRKFFCFESFSHFDLFPFQVSDPNYGGTEKANADIPISVGKKATNNPNEVPKRGWMLLIMLITENHSFNWEWNILHISILPDQITNEVAFQTLQPICWGSLHLSSQKMPLSCSPGCTHSQGLVQPGSFQFLVDHRTDILCNKKRFR